MEWYFILIIVLVILFIPYYILSIITYKNLIPRGVEKPLNECDLTNTQYKPYINNLYSDMEFMGKKEYKEITINSFDGLKLYDCGVTDFPLYNIMRPMKPYQI